MSAVLTLLLLLLSAAVQGSSVFKVPRKPRPAPPSAPPLAPLPQQTLWVSEALSGVIGRFAPRGGSPECEKHSQLYREGLENLTLWAVQMHDSSAYSAFGLLPGNSYQLGHFDSCVTLGVSSLGLTGRYCLADIHFWPAPQTYPGFHTPHTASKFVSPDNRLSVWERIRVNSDLSHRRRDVLHWAVCVPASCSAEVVATSLDSALQNSSGLGLGFKLSLGSRRCYAQSDDLPLPLGFYVVWAVIAIAALIACTATGMDFFVYQPGREHSRIIRRWLRPFSMYKNMGKLVTPNSNSEFAEFHVYKFIAMMFVISGHRQMYAIGQTPLYNVDWVEQLNSYFVDIVIMNGGIVVDTFFVLSGFLTCHYVLQELDKHKRFNFIVVFLNRLIRIAPVYMVVVGFYSYVFPHLGDGPLWTERLTLEAERCRQNWWTNMLFINNYVNSDSQCLVQSWYLACDMQFFVVASVLVYLLWRWPRLGTALLWTALAASIVVPAAITYHHSYYGTVLHYMSLMKDPMAVQHYRDLYIPGHTRAGPYLLGIITASWYLRLKRDNFRFSPVALAVGSLAAGALLLASCLVGWICYDRARPYGLWENTLYAGTHRAAWALGLAWFVVAEGTTGFGTIYKVVKHRFFTPFGRLTYCVFLVHTIPQIYLTSSTRVPEYLTVPKLFWVVTGDAASAYILALYLNLLFEAPLERLQKKTIKRLMRANGEAKPHTTELPQNGLNGVSRRTTS